MSKRKYEKTRKFLAKNHLSPTKSFSNDNQEKKQIEINNGIVYITYKIDRVPETQLFGEIFVENNENNCKIIIGDKEYDIKASINLNVYGIKKANQSFTIALKGNSITDMSYMFSGCTYLINVDFSHFNSYGVTNMENLFSYCTNLINLDLTALNTKNVTNMRKMFHRCENLISIDLTSFNTENVTNMEEMFFKCTKIMNIDLSSFNTQKVKNMKSMFSWCLKLVKVDLSSFDTKNVVIMEEMFARCNCLINIDISSFSTLKVNNMKELFARCFKINNIKVNRNTYDKAKKSSWRGQKVIIEV